MKDWIESKGYKYYGHSSYDPEGTVYWAKSKLVNVAKFQIVIKQHNITFGHATTPHVSYEVGSCYATNIEIPRGEDDREEAWADMKFYSLREEILREKLEEMEKKLEEIFKLTAGGRYYD